MEAAEAVCAGIDLAADQVLEQLGALADNSLVHVEPVSADGEQRFGMLETVREFAQERLATAENDGGETVREQHAAYYLSIAEQAAPEVRDAQQVTWLERLDLEQANMRAGLQWAADRAAVETSLRLAKALVPFWEARGSLHEGRHWLETALADPGSAGVESLAPRRVGALLGVGRLALWQADAEAADAFLTASLAQARERDDPAAIGASLTWLGMLRRRQRAFADAQQLLEQALPLVEAAGDHWTAAWAFYNLGHLAFNANELPKAQPLLEASLRAFEELGDIRHVGLNCTILGTILARLGERERSSHLLRAGLAHWEAVGERIYLFSCLRDLASVALLWDQPLRAARLLGAAQPLGEALGAVLAPVNRAMQDRLVAALQARLTPTEFAAAQAAGHAMRTEEVLAEAMAAVHPTSSEGVLQDGLSWPYSTLRPPSDNDENERPHMDHAGL